MAVAWLRSTPGPLLPVVVVGGGGPPDRGIPLLEAAEGDEVEVAEADTDEGGSKEAKVVGNVVDEDPLWAFRRRKKNQIFHSNSRGFVQF